MKEIYEDMLIMESLDKPYQLRDVTEINKDHAKTMEDRGFQNVKFYSCDDEPKHYFMTGDRSGAFEIHHQHISDDGEEMTGKNNVLGKPASKFIATAFTLVRPVVDSGKCVRIIAPPIHIDHYHRIAKTIGRRFNYPISATFPEADGMMGFMIGKHPNPLFGIRLNKK